EGVARRGGDIKVGTGPEPVIPGGAGIAHDLRLPTVAQSSDGGGQGGQGFVTGERLQGFRDGNSGSHARALNAGGSHGHPGLLIEQGIAVDDLQDRHGTVAYRLHRLNRVLPQEQPAVAGAVVQLVKGGADEAPTAVFFDHFRNGGNQHAKQRILAGVGDALNVLLGAGHGNQVFGGHGATSTGS